MSVEALGNALVGLLPVVCFLASLIYLDSYKLVPLRAVLYAIVFGAFAAGASYAINVGLLEWLHGDPRLLTRYAAPVVEELVKGAAIVYLLRSRRVGFLVDTAIFAFAVGTGFSLMENLYYMHALAESRMIVWIVRGFGTAIMHGGTTVIFGVVSKTIAERRDSLSAISFLPGLLAAMVLHSIFNHFVFSPVFQTAAILVLLPPLIHAVFRRSERSLKRWLGVGFDTDAELLEQLHSGEFSESRIGRYLQSLRGHFRGEVLGDMVCYIQLNVELAMRAKGVLLAREAGLDLPPDPHIAAKLAELRFLERSIGRTGMLAITPFLHASGRDVWQRQVLARH